MKLISKQLYFLISFFWVFIISCSSSDVKQDKSEKISKKEIARFVNSELNFSDTVALKRKMNSTAWDIVSYYYIKENTYDSLGLSSFFDFILSNGVVEHGEINSTPCTCLSKIDKSHGEVLSTTDICFRRINDEIKVVYLNHGK